MRAETMAAVLYDLGRQPETSECEPLVERKSFTRFAPDFSAERFARAQICGLVRQVFFSRITPPVRHVVFSGIEPRADIAGICNTVGEVLATETERDVVVVTSNPESGLYRQLDPPEFVQTGARQVKKDLWSLHLPSRGAQITTRLLKAYMEEIRREFEYSIVAAWGGDPNETLAIGQSADGIVLVLSAMRTRRAGAVRVRDALAQLHLLGTVLTDREFPIPATIYRRL